MGKALTETQVLEKLNIPDFRHLSRDNVMSFASMIQDMDPEVAKKALEQFPQFAQTAIESLKDIRETAVKVLDDDKESTARFYDICDEIIAALKASLSVDDLSFEEKKYYIEQMKEVAEMVAVKDSEGKKFKWSTLATYAFAAVVLLGTAAALLGGNSNISTKD